MQNARELWFPLDGLIYRECNATNGEDPTCSDSLYPWQLRPADHLLYLDIDQKIQSSHDCGNV